MGISVGSNNFEDTVINGQDWDIECSSSQIEDENVLLSFLIKTIGNGGSSGLVQDSDDIEASDDTGILGGLSLRVIEISWDGDDGVFNLFTGVGFSNLFHFD